MDCVWPLCLCAAEDSSGLRVSDAVRHREHHQRLAQSDAGHHQSAGNTPSMHTHTLYHEPVTASAPNTSGIRTAAVKSCFTQSNSFRNRIICQRKRTKPLQTKRTKTGRGHVSPQSKTSSTQGPLSFWLHHMVIINRLSSVAIDVWMFSSSQHFHNKDGVILSKAPEHSEPWVVNCCFQGQESTYNNNISSTSRESWIPIYMYVIEHSMMCSRSWKWQPQYQSTFPDCCSLNRRKNKHKNNLKIKASMDVTQWNDVLTLVLDSSWGHRVICLTDRKALWGRSGIWE